MRRGWMRFLAACAVFIGMVVLGGVGLLALALEDYARVPPPQVSFTPEHIERAVNLFGLHDPRKLVRGAQGVVTVSQDDLDLATRYLAQRFGRTNSRLQLRDGGLSWASSTQLPPLPLGLPLGADRATLNLQVDWQVVDGQASITRMQIGKLPIPRFVANPIQAFALEQVRDNSRSAAFLLDSLSRIQVSANALQLHYIWQGLPPESTAPPRWFAEDQARVKAYGPWFARQPDAVRKRLDTLLPPLLALAAQRSESNGSNEASGDLAIAENRAALIALALYVNGEALAALLPAKEPLVAPSTSPVTLAGRPDTAQHFTVSAALAATAGTPLTDAVGLYKEINDSRGGSGFSFNDLAADRAGTRLGELATNTAPSARRLQQFMQTAGAQNPATGNLLLPPVDDLPENLQQADFARRFGQVDGPAARRLRGVIEQRLAMLPLYQLASEPAKP